MSGALPSLLIYLHDVHGDNFYLYFTLLRYYVNFKSSSLLQFLWTFVFIVWGAISCSPVLSTHSIRTVWRVTAVFTHVSHTKYILLSDSYCSAHIVLSSILNVRLCWCSSLLGPGGLGLNPGGGYRPSLLHTHPDRPWNSSCLLYSG